MANGFDDFAEGFASTFSPGFASSFKRSEDRFDDAVADSVKTFRANQKLQQAQAVKDKEALETAETIINTFNLPAAAKADVAAQVQNLGASATLKLYEEGYKLVETQPTISSEPTVSAPVAEDANASAKSVNEQMADLNLDEETDTVEAQTEKGLFGRLKDRANERYQDRLKTSTMNRLGVGEEDYEKMMTAGYTPETSVTSSGTYTLQAPPKKADFAFTYAKDGGVNTFNLSTKDGIKKYQESVKGGASPISKPTLTGILKMNNVEVPDYQTATFYNGETQTYEQVNIKSQEGVTRAGELVEKGYNQVANPSADDLNASKFDINLDELNTYGKAFAALTHISHLQTESKKAGKEEDPYLTRLASRVTEIKTALTPTTEEKAPKFVAVRVGNNPTRYFDLNKKTDVTALEVLKSTATGSTEIRISNISTEPAANNFVAPVWKGTDSSFDSIVYQAQINQDAEGVVGEWAKNWLKTSKPLIEKIIGNETNYTEAYIKSEYTRLYTAAQGKGADSQEAKDLKAFQNDVVPGFLEINNQINPEETSFASELIKLREMERGNSPQSAIDAQRKIVNDLLESQSVAKIAEEQAGKFVQIVNPDDGQYVDATQIVDTDGAITFRLRDGSTVSEANNFRPVRDSEIADAEAAVSSGKPAREKFAKDRAMVESIVTLGGEIVEIVNKEPKALTFTAQKLAPSIKSLFQEVDTISSVLESYFTENGKDKITLETAESELRQAGILQPGETFESLINKETSTLASMGQQLEAKIFLMAFRAGAVEGQSGQAMSNRDFDRLLKIIGDSTDADTFREKLNSYLAGSVTALNTRFEDVNEPDRIDLFIKNYGYSPLRGDDYVRSWESVSTDPRNIELTRAIRILDPETPPLQAYQYLKENPDTAGDFADEYGAEYLPYSMRGTYGN